MSVARWQWTLAWLIAALTIPAAAAGAWTAPAPVPGASGLPFPPSLEFSRSGIGLITTELGKPQTLGSVVTGDTPGPVKPLSPDMRLYDWALYGKDAVVGVGFGPHHTSVRAGFGTIAGGITRIQTVATGPAGTSDLDANGRGTAAIVFTKAHGLYLAVKQPGRRNFGEAIRISGTGHALVDPEVRVNSAGDVLAAWISSGPYPRCRCRSPRQSVVARILTSTGRFSGIQRLGPGAAFQDIQLAFADNRAALVGWLRDFPADTIRVAYASAGGRWHPTQILDSFSDKRAEFEPEPGIRLAFSSDGHGEAVWDSGVPASRVVRAAELSGTTFGSPQTLSAPGVNTGVDSLAADAHGGLVATWGQGAAGASKLFAAVRSGSEWGAAAQLGDGSASQVAIDPVTGVPLAVFGTISGVFYSKNAG